MNTMLIQSPSPALHVRSPAEQHRVCHRWRRCGHARGSPRTSFIDGEDVTGSCAGETSTTDVGMRFQLATLKSP